MKSTRCNLSGIYIFDQLEGDEKRLPTCIEDCTEETRNEWLNSLNKEGLISTINHLCKTLKEISNQFGIIAGNYE